MSALDLLATRVLGHALPRPFYTDAEIHHIDLQTATRRSSSRCPTTRTTRSVPRAACTTPEHAPRSGNPNVARGLRMSRAIPGLHHVTAISGPLQANVDFYVETMRQRLVEEFVSSTRRTPNHLYYGDRTGSPGMILTFFPFADAAPGCAGPGMASAVAYRGAP